MRTCRLCGSEAMLSVLDLGASPPCESQYQGALVVVTHDDALCERLGLDAVFTVTGPDAVSWVQA